MSVLDLGSSSSETEDEEMENGGIRLRVPSRKTTSSTQRPTVPQRRFCNFELRHMVCDFPPPTAKIDVILVVGPTTDTDTAVCERFARDFEYYHLNIPTYLRSLFASGTYDCHSLGLLHPHAFREFMQKRQEVKIPDRLVAQIAKLKIDVEVQRHDKRKFLISGLGTAVEIFEKDVANHSAIFFFSDAQISSHQAVALDLLNGIPINSGGLAVESSYGELLRAIYLKAGQPRIEVENNRVI